jgi:EAL domain-containing protein (putative c-di-GMP-specific phosphodiesterase class I)
LVRLGCRLGQGFLYAPSQPPEQIARAFATPPAPEPARARSTRRS